MKYQSSITKKIYDITFSNKMNICPECSVSRNKNKSTDLQYNAESNRAYCHHCNTTLFVYKPYETKKYDKPEWKNKTELTDDDAKWFESRMIKQETVKFMKIYSDIEWMPQYKKEVKVICFPYFVNENLINIKYRGPHKTFKLVSKAQLVWYNYNAILKNDEIIICEGELDCLAIIHAGYKNCISVPNGAGNFEFLDDSIHLFNDKKIIIAVDNDSKGILLRDELIRRLGSENCSVVNFKQYKDANDYLINCGGFELKEAIKNAKDIQIEGNISIDSFRPDLLDLFINGLVKGKITGLDEIDKYCSWETQRLAVVGGRPGSGKSEFINFLICLLNLLYGWKAAYFTPENLPLKFHYANLYEKYIGKKFSSGKSDQADFDTAYEYLKDNIFYILPESDLTIDKILINAKSLVKTKGIKILVIDAYNKLEYQVGNNQTETLYISQLLDKLIMFAKKHDVLIFLIAHPRKLEKNTIPTLYDISGSSHFYNKTDYGFTVHRKTDSDNIMTSQVEIHWQKIKFKHLGEQGISELIYNYNNGRYQKQQTIDDWDNSNWLVKRPGITYDLSPNANRFENLNDDDNITNDEAGCPF